MYYCSYISEKHEKEWNILVNKESGFHQSFYWGEFKKRDGWEVYKIGIFNSKNKIIGGALLLRFTFRNGTNFLYIPEGLILDSTNTKNIEIQYKIFMEEIFTICSINTTHLRIEPRKKEISDFLLKDFKKAPLNLLPKFTRIINLENGTTKILYDMKQKCRYNINLSKRKLVEVSKINDIKEKDIKMFFSLYKNTYQKNDFEGKNIMFFKKLIDSFGKNIKIFFSKIDGKIISTSIVIYFGNRVTYLYGGTNYEMRKYMGAYLMHWKIIEDAKKLGYKEYDFWGISENEDDKNHPWYGFTQFKKGFGGEKIEFCGAYDYIFNYKKYISFLEKHEL